MFAAFFRHWYVKDAEPVAATENDTGAPGQTVCDAGGVVTVGTALTVSTAGFVVTGPHAFVSTQSYVPAFAGVTAPSA